MWWQLSPLISSKFGHTVLRSFFSRFFLPPRLTLHECIKLARQCSHGIFFSLKRDTKALYISSVVTDGMFNETRWRTATSFFSSQKNDTRDFLQCITCCFTVLKKNVSWKLDISLSSINLANPNLILYDAVLLDNWVRFKALQSFDNSFAMSIIFPVRVNERFFSAQYYRTKASWFGALSATDTLGIGRRASLV